MRGTINLTPEALAEFDEAVMDSCVDLEYKLQINNYDFKTTIPASARMGEAMLSTSCVRGVTADFIKSYCNITEAIRNTLKETDVNLADNTVTKLGY